MDTIHGNIKLNATHETNNKVNFLDFSITRKPTSLELDIYRKTTASDTTIKFLSNRPLRHKLAAYRFFINRMLSLPLSEVWRHKVWGSNKQTAHNNNIPIHLLTKLRCNIQNKLDQPHRFHTEQKMGHLHTLLTACQKNHQPLQKHKCQKWPWKQQHIWQLTKPHTTTIPSPTPHDISGNYSLTCNTCKLAYVGHTSRTLKLRYHDHTCYVKNNDPRSAHALHILRNRHKYGPIDKTMTLLKPLSNTSLLTPYEQSYIHSLHKEGKLIYEQSPGWSELSAPTCHWPFPAPNMTMSVGYKLTHNVQEYTLAP